MERFIKTHCTFNHEVHNLKKLNYFKSLKYKYIDRLYVIELSTNKPPTPIDKQYYINNHKLEYEHVDVSEYFSDEAEKFYKRRNEELNQ